MVNQTMGDSNFKIMQEGFRESQAKRLEKNIEEAKETGKFLFESLPGISTAVTAQDITEELQKENPSYGKIALLGGSELIGLIPGLGTAAKVGLRAAAKKAGLNKVVDAIDAVPTDAPTSKPESEIIAGPGATGYEGLDLEKARKLKSMGYGSRQIEDMTGRFETGSVDDYIKNKKPQIIPNADLHELDNLRGVKEHLENLITDMKINPSDYSLKSFALTDHIKIKQEELLKVNQKLTKLEKKYPTEFIEIESPFKFEIPDKGIIIKENNKYINYKEAIESSPMLVGDMVPTHKKLFKEYPHLEQVQFYIDPTLGNGAHFDPSKGLHGSIVVGDDFVGALDNINSPVFRNTFFHELQHAAQYQDFRLAGLSQLGGGPTTFAKAITGKAPYGIGFEAAAILKNPRAVKLKDEIINLFQKETKGLNFISTNSGNRYSNPKVAAKMAKLMRELEVENYKTYMKIASEVEAGAVGARAMPTFAKDQVRVSSEIAKRKKIETAEEYWKNKPDSRIKKIQKKLKSTVPMNQQEIEKYTGGGINFARYALGIDKELQGFTAFGVKESKRFNKGGLETGERIMNNQMEMAFMQQGGLKDDGMRQDPVSGNPIPNGSMAEEVRDDIPAQLSEGEYVVPADVVRYYGVKHFEDIRNGAKQGLQNMEANGRIGGEPVPVGGPKAAPQQMPQQQQMASDLSQDEMNELQSMMMNVGGFVDQPADPYQQQQTMYQQPMVMGAQAGTLATNNPTLFATTPSTISSGFSFEPPQQAAPAVDQAAKDAAETAKGTADCAAEGKDYDPVTKTCKPKTPQVTSGGDDGPAPTETPDPNAWMGEYDYTDPAQLSEQITAALTTSKEQPSGIFGLLFNQFAPVGGLIDMVSKGANAAKQAANIQLLKANNQPTGDLETLLEKYITDNRLTPLENLNLISGDGFYKTLIAEKGENPFGPGTTKTVVKPTKEQIKASDAANIKFIGSTTRSGKGAVASGSIKGTKGIAATRAEKDKESGNAFESLDAAIAAGKANKSSRSAANIKRITDPNAGSYSTEAKAAAKKSLEGQKTYIGGRNKGGLATRRKTKGK